MKRIKMLASTTVAVLIFTSINLTYASANDKTSDSKGSVTFIVNPDDPNQQVVPDDNSEVTTDTVVNDSGTSSHSYVKPSDDVTVVSNNTEKLPDTGYNLDAEGYLTFLGFISLGVAAYITYRRL